MVIPIIIYLEQFDNETIVLLSLALMLSAGFLITRLTKKLKLPNVTGYIISGILIGPYVLNFIPNLMIDNISFISDVALAFVAFDVGKFFKRKVFQDSGVETIVITLLETFVSGLFITLTMYYLFSLDLSFSLLLGAIATATSPASTIMTINEYKAKGPFVYTLLQVVALDDVVSIILFSIASAVVSALSAGELTSGHVFMPLLYNLLFIIIGLLAGILLSKLFKSYVKTKESRLTIVLIILLTISGLGTIFNLSPLLSCMVFSTTYINLTNDEKIYKEVGQFSPPILMLFFVLSGMTLDLTALTSLGTIGVVYFFIRIIGKYIGAFLGSALTNTSTSIRNYLGFALIPQAGVAIGLAFLGGRMLPASEGNKLITIILASSVLYELIGPVAAKWSLFQSGAIQNKS